MTNQTSPQAKKPKAHRPESKQKKAKLSDDGADSQRPGADANVTSSGQTNIYASDEAVKTGFNHDARYGDERLSGDQHSNVERPSDSEELSSETD